MAKPEESRFEYIVHFVAPFKDPRFKEPQLEDNLYLVEMTQEQADVIVFGSEYRTAAGLVKPGISAHKLLLGGPAAIAVAPAGFHADPAPSIDLVGVIDEGDSAARGTANSLAAALGAEVADHAPGRIDLLVVGSRPEALDGRVVLSAASDYAVEAANYPVLVIPRGVELDFGSTPQPAAG